MWIRKVNYIMRINGLFDSLWVLIYIRFVIMEIIEIDWDDENNKYFC